MTNDALTPDDKLMLQACKVGHAFFFWGYIGLLALLVVVAALSVRVLMKWPPVPADRWVIPVVLTVCLVVFVYSAYQIRLRYGFKKFIEFQLGA